jgi:large subunit ribosomal protein L9
MNKKTNTKTGLILLKQVKSLGKVGDLVEVRRGYARNWLLPYGYALKATKEVLLNREQLKSQALQDVDKQVAAAQQLAARLEDTVYTTRARADAKGHLYASINTQDVFNLINAKEQLVARKDIAMSPIKTIGEHVITLNFFNDHTCHVTIDVQRVAHF